MNDQPKSYQTISELIDTVICGNKITGDATYEKMAKSITFTEIRNYLRDHEYDIIDVYWVMSNNRNWFPKYCDIKINKLDFFDTYVKNSF